VQRDNVFVVILLYLEIIIIIELLVAATEFE